MFQLLARLFRQHRHVVIVLKPGEAAVIYGHMEQARKWWDENPQYRCAYLERAMIQAQQQTLSQLTGDLAEDAAEDIAIAQAMGEYPDYPA